MANSIKAVKRRIKSIDNTRKITRAMEMVAAAKMRKQVDKVIKVRSYAHSAWSVLVNLKRAFREYESKISLLRSREVRRVCVIVITSNRGLCGSFNSQIIKKVVEQVKNPRSLKINRVGNRKIESQVADGDLAIDIITVGKKGRSFFAKMGFNIVAHFEELTYLPTIEDIGGLVKIIIDDYSGGKYDKVVIAYTDYVNTLVQQPKVRQLLPISRVDLEKQIAEMDAQAQEFGLKEPSLEYKVEPDPITVLEHILPRFVEMQIYHAILESNASKESAQMVAMRNATEAAEEMKEELVLGYNQIRQMNITREIAEISAGRAALEN